MCGSVISDELVPPIGFAWPENTGEKMIRTTELMSPP
jgi:hypothetical protein